MHARTYIHARMLLAYTYVIYVATYIIIMLRIYQHAIHASVH